MSVYIISMVTDDRQTAPDQELEEAKPRGILAWLRYAFAIEEFSEDSLSAEEKDVLARIAGIIHRRGMSTPAILWIESHRHLSFTGSQLVKMAEPLHDLSYQFMQWLMMKLGVGYISPEDLSRLQSALEKRYSIEYLLQQIEEQSAGDSLASKESPAGTPETKPGNSGD